jgi:hypothetical protein
MTTRRFNAIVFGLAALAISAAASRTESDGLLTG